MRLGAEQRRVEVLAAGHTSPSTPPSCDAASSSETTGRMIGVPPAATTPCTMPRSAVSASRRPYAVGTTRGTAVMAIRGWGMEVTDGVNSC